MEDEQRKCLCGMPLDEKTQCNCNPDICIHCCDCPADCECGCRHKVKEEISMLSDEPV